MKILALQLKRIGDLILTTPALAAIRAAFPKANLSLMVADACGELVPALEGVDRGLVLRRGAWNGAVWKTVLATRYDACLDFTGNDRSALLTAVSLARRRVTFDWVKKSKWRALAYSEFAVSSVRERHTVDHYLDLAHALTGLAAPAGAGAAAPAAPHLSPSASASEAARRLLGDSDFVLIHPGTARPEKYWLPERWAAVITHIQMRHGIKCVITGGAHPFEQQHIRATEESLPQKVESLAGRIDLLTLAALVERSRAVLSCDTGIVHIAAAFSKPQVALYGPTNPYHWRPRHSAAIILSAANPAAPLTEFRPGSKGAPMDAISTEAVICATDCLLASLRPC